MAKFRKRALQPATYHSGDGRVEVTPKRLKHWQDNFRRMQDAGYTVPIGWDHASTLDGITPLSADDFKKRSAKDTVGKLSSIALDAKGGAVLEFDVTDPQAQGRADRNEIFISPVIMDEWRDGAGNLYKDVITHVDFVNHPVDYSQGRFEKAETGAIACALRMGLDTKVYRMAFGDDEDDDKKKDGEESTSEGSPADESTASDPSPAENKNPDMPTGETSESDKRREALIAHLAEMSIVLPSDTNAENFEERLLTAVMTKNALESSQETEEESETEEEDPMKVADPAFATMSLMFERKHREGIAKELQTALEQGRITPAEHAEYSPKVGVVKLSLDEKGEPKASDVETFLAHRANVPNGTFWSPEKKTQMLSATPVPHPAAMSGELTQEQIDQAANFALGRKAKK